MFPEIPDKTYFKIGEAAKLVGVKPHILRYWESEFRVIRPAKTRSQQRLFRQRDIEMLLVVRALLYEHRFTIEGARLKLRELGEAGRTSREMLDSLRQGVLPTVAPPDVAPSTEVDVSDEVRSLRAENAALGEKLALANQKLNDAAELLRAERARLRQELDALRDEARVRAGAATARVAALEAELLEAREHATHGVPAAVIESVRASLLDLRRRLSTTTTVLPR